MSAALDRRDPVAAPLLSACQLGFAYGAQQVLAGVDFAVYPGEVVALIGPNGAGKSTLLKLLAGLLSPAEGQVEVPLPRARSLAYLAQSEELPLDWSVRATVELGRFPYIGLFRRMTAVDHAAVNRALTRTSTLHSAGRTLATLSGGERQRVALARALAQHPRVLLLDEPTAHLDVRHQVELLTLLRDVAAEGVAVVAVMHDLTLAGHADRCLVLADGALQADGPPALVLTPQLLQRIYHTELEVLRTGAGRAVVVPASAHPNATAERPKPMPTSSTATSSNHPRPHRVVLIGGGVRSGKSSFAVERALALGPRRGFIATATRSDSEMNERIDRHRRDRRDAFTTVEEPLALAQALRAMSGQNVVVVDCLTLWLSNLLIRKDPIDVILQQVDEVVAVLERREFDAILVTNEVGMSVHPPTELGRRFVEVCGFAHQRFARASDEVHLAVLGTTLRIRPAPGADGAP